MRGVDEMDAADIAIAGGALKRDVNARVRLERLRRLYVRDSLVPLYGTGPTAGITPPTITLSADGASSTVDGQGYNNPRVPWNDTRISYGGRVSVAGNTSPRQYYGAGVNTNYDAISSGLTTINGRGYKSDVSIWRWMTDEPVFDIGLNGSSVWELWIDGQPATRSNNFVPQLTNFMLNVSWGADAMTYSSTVSPTVSAGGSGYAVGNTFNVSGGTSTTAASGQVTSVSGGVVTGARITTPGVYSAVPTSPAATSATSGTGTGLTLSPTWYSNHSTRKMRRYELRLANTGLFAGLHTSRKGVVRPWPVTGPRFIAITDSLGEGNQEGWPGGSWCGAMRELMGIDDFIVSGVGGTGWIIAPGSKLTFRSRLATDLYPLAPTDPSIPLVVIFEGGANEIIQGSSAAAVQAEVTTALSEVIAALPNAFIVVTGPAIKPFTSGQAAAQAIQDAIIAGAQAATGWTSRRHATVPIMNDLLLQDDGYGIVAGNSALTANSGQWVASDQIHWGPAGHEFVGRAITQAIYDLIQNTWAA